MSVSQERGRGNDGSEREEPDVTRDGRVSLTIATYISLYIRPSRVSHEGT